jgi:glycosyltransferase involved in cell wall biosynthesis
VSRPIDTRVEENRYRSGGGWIVSQIGAREHYSIARGLSRRQELELLVTDSWRPSWLGPRAVKWVGWKPLQRWAGRFADGLDGKVVSFNLQSSLARTWHYGRRHADRAYFAHLDHGRWFARKTARVVKHSRAKVFFGYCTGSLEALAAAKKMGAFTIVDQIDPALEEWKLVEAERERFPNWEERPPEAPAAYWNRLRAEWDAADLVVVNSEWSRKSLAKQGVPLEKMAVVPLAYEPTFRAQPKTSTSRRPLQVLWLGTVNLRKGIPYLLEAARKLPEVDFQVAGPLKISQPIVANAPANVKFHGQVPRLFSADYFRAADVFLLPTVSDGFAITQLEAMAWGLPVITTSHCGEVVIDDHNGYIVPARDSDAIARRLADLDSNRGHLADLSMNAARTLDAFTLEKVTDRLVREVQLRSRPRNGSPTADKW